MEDKPLAKYNLYISLTNPLEWRGRLVLWDVLRVGRFKSRKFSDGTFWEWDVSRAGSLVMGRFESGTFQEQDV
jgi:hypothetical protein